MELDFIMKAAGIAMTAALTCQILSKIGKDDYSSLVSVAGIITLLVVLLREISEIFNTVRDIFNI